MSDTNVVVVGGNLGDDVSYRVIPQSGKGVAEIRIATNKHRLKPDGGFDTSTSWVTVKFFGKIADRVRDKLSKGDKVTITGELSEDRWVDKNSGQNRSKLFIVANSYEYHGRATKSPDAGNHQGQPQQQSTNRGERSSRGQTGQGQARPRHTQANQDGIPPGYR